METESVNVNLDDFDFHLNHQLTGTITGVNPVSRFGRIEEDEDLVLKFVEKPKLEINGSMEDISSLKRNLGPICEMPNPACLSKVL